LSFMENLITKMVQYLAFVTLRIYTKYRHKENGNARSESPRHSKGSGF
jgi:hypothetical protein